MQLLAAPMEGVTGYLFRRAHAAVFGGADGYLTPFLSPTETGVLSPRERADVLPAHNEGLPVIPQILTRRSDCFIWAARKLADLGYREVNLNLGCPSGTVTAKGKGAGFLARPDELERFLDEIFTAVPLSISVKTRLGMERPEEFGPLLELYNRYPICRLDVHPRTRAQFYSGAPDLAAFALAAEQSRAPVCYNGNLFTPADLDRVRAAFPGVSTFMAGRGLVAYPGLFRLMAGGAPMTREEVRRFHALLYEGYLAAMPGPRPTLARMKELWAYLLFSFTNRERYLRPMRRASTLPEYESVAAAILTYEDVLPPGALNPQEL